jgi:hypothetical protein
LKNSTAGFREPAANNPKNSNRKTPTQQFPWRSTVGRRRVDAQSPPPQCDSDPTWERAFFQHATALPMRMGKELRGGKIFDRTIISACGVRQLMESQPDFIAQMVERLQIL